VRPHVKRRGLSQNTNAPTTKTAINFLKSLQFYIADKVSTVACCLENCRRNTISDYA